MNTTKRLASVTVAAAAAAGLTLAMTPAASATATATATRTTTYTQKCTVGILGSRDLPTKVVVTGPTAVARNAPFSVSTKITVTVPSSVNQAAYALGARSQKVVLSTINVNTTKTTTPTKDITGTGSLAGPKIVVPATGTSTIAFPAKAASFKAASTTGIATAKTGSISGLAYLYNSSGALVGGQPQKITCGAQNVLVFSLKVT